MEEINNEEDLHVLLWEARDRLGRVRIHQINLSSEINVPQYTISRWIKKLIKSQGLKRIKREQGNIQIYSVREPLY